MNKKRIKKGTIGVYIVLSLGAVVMLVPFLWMVLTSFKTYKEAVAVPLVWFPSEWNLDNYIKVLESFRFGKYYMNTIIVTLLTVSLMMFLCCLSAFAFARMEFPFKNVIFSAMLIIFMVPGQMTIIPKYAIITKLGWVDTLAGIVVPNVFSIYSMFLLRQFFASIPRELEDSAKIDGCSYPRILWNICLPLSKSGLVAVGVLNTLWAWNDFMWPLVATSTDKLRVLSVAIATLQGEHGTEYPTLMAAGVMALVPMLVMYILGQKQFIEGIAFTGVKG